MYEDEQYYKNILSDMHLLKCRPAKEPSPTSQQQKIEDDNFLNETEHSLYRRVVGKLQWVVVLRPDLAFTVKELARALTQPTYDDLTRLKHCMRYVSGTLHYRTTLHPQIRLDPSRQNSYDIDIITDANWAGCALTRKSTSGVCVRLLGTCVHFSSKTQAVHALSSAESELYAMGAGAADGLHLRSFLYESGLASSATITIQTDY
jgi:hypothetical protein